MAETELQELKDKIKTITDENSLRSLREFSDRCLQEAKEKKAQVSKSEFEAKYKDKYLVIYGRHVTMMSSVPNKNDIKIVHVLGIDFKGHGFFRCHAKIVHITFNDEWKRVAHLTSDWGSSYISYSEDEQFDIHESDIDEVYDDNTEIKKLIKLAKDDFNDIIDTWDV
jgi:hypothetical protein